LDKINFQDYLINQGGGHRLGWGAGARGRRKKSIVQLIFSKKISRCSIIFRQNDIKIEIKQEIIPTF
jgi:hypothetical protein